MALTKDGVCYELPDSPYTLWHRGLLYHFSSTYHLRKFRDGVTAREQWLDDSLTRRFKVAVHLPYLADLQWYCICETRGFYVVSDDGATYSNPRQIFITEDRLSFGVADGLM